MLFVNKKYESLSRIFELDAVNENSMTNLKYDEYVSSVMNLMKTTGQIEIYPAPKSKSSPITVSVNSSKIGEEIPETVEEFNKLFFNKWLTEDAIEQINAGARIGKNGRSLYGMDETNGWSFIYKSDAVKGKSGGSGSVSAADMEVVIAFAYNNKYSEYNKDVEANISYSAQKTGKDLEKIIEPTKVYYENNKTWLDGVADSIYKYFAKSHKINALRKLPDSEISGVSDVWKGKKTPKTDLISDDNEIRLSLKKADTGAQAMSGKYDEAESTVINVLNRILRDPNYTKSRELKFKLKAAINAAEDESIKDIKLAISNIKNSSSNYEGDISDEEIKDLVKNTLFRVVDNVESTSGGWHTKSISTSYLKSLVNKEVGLNAYEIGKIAHQKLSRILFGILETDDDFKKALVREALTGEIKFSNAPIAIANYVLSWEEGKPSCAIEDIYDYIDAKAKYITSTINFKSSEGKGSSSMRLLLPKTTVEDEIQRIAAAAAEKAKREITNAALSATSSK